MGVDTGRLLVISCYLPPSLSPEQYANILGEVEHACALYRRAEILIGGDFNAKVDEWGSGRTDEKGRMLDELASGLGLQCENTGSVPTFQSPVGQSVVDFTLSRLAGGNRITNWTVESATYTGSDHCLITYEFGNVNGDRSVPDTHQHSGWAIKKLNTAKLHDYIRNHVRGRSEDWMDTEPEAAAEQYGQYLEAGCDHAMPKRSATNRRRAAYWWNEDIAEKRRLCLVARRRYL